MLTSTVWWIISCFNLLSAKIGLETIPRKAQFLRLDIAYALLQSEYYAKYVYKLISLPVTDNNNQILGNF